MEYERLEPFGSWRDNYHAGLLASILVNVFRSQNRKPVGISEFMYVDPDTAQEIHDETLLENLRSRKKH